MSRGPSGGTPDKGLWEKVEPAYPTTLRLPVPGGWIYYVEPAHREPVGVFVPEPVGFRLNCPKCNAEAALDPHGCPLRPAHICTCGVSCSEHCRMEKEQS